jgi:hypothetical protein
VIEWKAKGWRVVTTAYDVFYFDTIREAKRFIDSDYGTRSL